MATWAPAMFGDVLVSNDGIEVKTVDALAGKTVGVYFSAHWCPPCRQFTPMLAGVYDTLKREGREFEVVFASSDRTDADFAEYHKSMPWLAVPFANRDAKAKLSSKFKVQGIPTLVILDENGALVTKDGRRAVAQPEKFPWTPPTLTEALGETFVDKSGGDDARVYRRGWQECRFILQCPLVRSLSSVHAETEGTVRRARRRGETVRNHLRLF